MREKTKHKFPALDVHMQEDDAFYTVASVALVIIHAYQKDINIQLTLLRASS